MWISGFLAISSIRTQDVKQFSMWTLVSGNHVNPPPLVSSNHVTPPPVSGNETNRRESITCSTLLHSFFVSNRRADWADWAGVFFLWAKHDGVRAKVVSVVCCLYLVKKLKTSPQSMQLFSPSPAAFFFMFSSRSCSRLNTQGHAVRRICIAQGSIPALLLGEQFIIASAKHMYVLVL